MQRTEIEQLLPGVFQRTIRPGSALYALLEVMEALQSPSEETLEHIETFFAPYHAPDHYLPFLARWLDLDRFLARLNRFSYFA